MVGDASVSVLTDGHNLSLAGTSFVLSRDDMILVSGMRGLRRRPKGAPWTEEGLSPPSLPVGLDCSAIATKAVRTKDGWWLNGGDRMWRWLDTDADVVELPFGLEGWRLAADPAASVVLSWGAGGFEVADGQAIRYREPDRAVDLAAVSPSGSLVATAGGGEVLLWRVTGSEQPEMPDQLELAPEEVAFLGEMAPLVPTPRLAKRLVNVYRLLRASAFGRARLGDPSTRDYRVAIVLLVLAVAWPAEANAVFNAIAAGEDGTWPDLLDHVLKVTDGDGRDALLCVRALSAERPSESITLYEEWSAEVQRFHVHAADSG